VQVSADAAEAQPSPAASTQQSASGLQDPRLSRASARIGVRMGISSRR
jgi:hypothetical protein